MTHTIDANDIDFDELSAKMKADTLVQCPDCHAYLIWAKLPDENIVMETEHETFWGAPCSYQTVVGYICPECGSKIDF